MFSAFLEKPFRLQLSFHKIIEGLEETAKNSTGDECKNAKALLARVNEHPELCKGITSEEQMTDNEELIADLLADLFPKALALNEIKAISVPYLGLAFNLTQRFKNILSDAGTEFKINIRDFDQKQLYIMSCCMILSRMYGTMVDLSKPMFYDIPTKTGIIKHYRILYNADFIELFATDEAPKLSQEDIDELIDNYNDFDLWKRKFPVDSYVIKGFGLMTLVDVTVENALSKLKSNLLRDYTSADLKKSLVSIFRSIYGIHDLQMGFTLFDQNEGKFMSIKFGPDIQSFLLPAMQASESHAVLCGEAYECIVKEHCYFTVSNVDAYIKQHGGDEFGRHFKDQNIQSFILAPVIKDNVLLGILELVSPRPRELNSVTANKLEIVMPFLVDTIDRKIHELQNRVQAIIQNYYTTLHPSVYWKFRREAQNYIQSSNDGLTYSLKEIKFKDVYPLYGQVDISESSITRNLSVTNDLRKQLKHLVTVLKALSKRNNDLPIKELLFDLKAFSGELAKKFRADTEQFIQNYIEEKVHPILAAAAPNKTLQAKIDNYFEQTNDVNGDFHTNRRNYDKTLSLINQKLAGILDRRQAEIQEFFPHYYERFKTDGVEHNMYIGATIAPEKKFDIKDLHRLRLWQLRVIAEMEVEQYDLKNVLPYKLGVTSLVLVFGTPIDIRFRMDEKHFDVDGAYNIRYEVIKKRIDKALINGKKERITKQGKITIIYAKNEEEQEYMGYISILQKAGVLADDVEHFEVEELQGVAGLKALRVGLIHSAKLLSQRGKPYDDLYKQLD